MMATIIHNNFFFISTYKFKVIRRVIECSKLRCMADTLLQGAVGE